MKLVTYRGIDGEARVGALVNGQVVDVNAALRAGGDGRFEDVPDIASLLATGPEAVAAVSAVVSAAGESARVASPELLAPIPAPPRIFCIGRNYAEHAKERGEPLPEFPMLFLKPTSSLAADGEAILISAVTDEVDWEGELAVVIGTAGRDIAEADALSHVGGYTVSNDVSARDVQRRTTQFDAGKMMDTYCPLGPAVTTADEVGDPQNLSIVTKVNGELMQDGNTRDMIFSVANLVAYLSTLVGLLPGDLILSGTPAGVGSGRKPPVFLKPGDEVAITIGDLGTLTNPVRAYSA